MATKRKTPRTVPRGLALGAASSKSLLAQGADLGDFEPEPPTAADRAALQKKRVDRLAHWLADDPDFLQAAGNAHNDVATAIVKAKTRLHGKEGRPDSITAGQRLMAESTYKLLEKTEPTSKLGWRDALVGNIVGFSKSSAEKIRLNMARKKRCPK